MEDFRLVRVGPILNLKNEMEKRKIVWDEETIAEHDKERGTRMKIEEPKTPFHYDFEEDGKKGKCMY